MKKIKALFAINQDAEWKVQKQFKELIEKKEITFTYDTEYNFEGVKARLQKEDFDIVILYEKLDVSKEISVRDIDLLADVTNTRILFIMEEREDLDKVKSIVAQGVYDILYAEDFNLSGVINLVLSPRDKKGAKEYLFIDEIEGVDYAKDIDFETIQNIDQSLSAIEDQEELKKAYEHIKGRYNDQQMKILFANISEELKEKLIGMDPHNRNYVPVEEEEVGGEKQTEKKSSLLGIGKLKDKTKPKQKIITKTSIKVEYRDVLSNATNKLVVFINLSPGAGSSFLAMNLAGYLNEHSIQNSLIESPTDPYLFDYLNIEDRLEKEEGKSMNFYSYQHEIFEGNTIRKNRDMKIGNTTMIVTDGRRPLIDPNDWKKDHFLNLLYVSKKTHVNILDLSSNFLEYEDDILAQADQVFIVVDPIPVKIMKNKDRFQKYIKYNASDEYTDLDFIVNRSNKKVQTSDLLDFNVLSYFPICNQDQIYESVFSFELPYKHVKEDIKKEMHKIAKKVIDEKYLKNSNSQKGLFKKLFKKGEK